MDVVSEEAVNDALMFPLESVHRLATRHHRHCWLRCPFIAFTIIGTILEVPTSLGTAKNISFAVVRAAEGATSTANQ